VGSYAINTFYKQILQNQVEFFLSYCELQLAILSRDKQPKKNGGPQRIRTTAYFLVMSHNYEGVLIGCSVSLLVHPSVILSFRRAGTSPQTIYFVYTNLIAVVLGGVVEWACDLKALVRHIET